MLTTESRTSGVSLSEQGRLSIASVALGLLALAYITYTWAQENMAEARLGTVPGQRTEPLFV